MMNEKIIVTNYTSRGHGCGNYNALIFVESKVLKQAHSKLRTCFSNAAISKNSVVRIRSRDHVKYIPRILGLVQEVENAK